MHDVAVIRISSQNIRDDLAESLRENTLVYVLDCVVYVLL
jgi:hypothetical protein